MIPQEPELIVRVVAAVDGDFEGIAGLAGRLRVELLDLDVAAVEPMADATVTEGAKGIYSVVGALAVWVGKAGLKAILAKIGDWVSRTGRSVEVTIDGDTVKVTGASRAQQEQLMSAWLARHAPNA